MESSFGKSDYGQEDDRGKAGGSNGSKGARKSRKKTQGPMGSPAKYF